MTDDNKTWMEMICMVLKGCLVDETIAIPYG